MPNTLSRPLERWANCSPVEMAKMSPAAIQFAFEDAKHDIALLAKQLLDAKPKWQPIETAPKDDREVLVWIPTLHSGEIAWFDANSGDWRNGGGYEIYPGPTHWQPLPEGPTV